MTELKQVPGSAPQELIRGTPSAWLSKPAIQSIEINWDYLIDRRPAMIAHSEDLPLYLLQPEIHIILDAAKHANTHLLLSLIWHTGARISEALSLTSADFYLDESYGKYISLPTLKQRGDKRKKPARRMVPVDDPAFIDVYNRYIATHKPGKTERLFDITRQGAALRLRNIISNLDSEYLSDIPISLKTFRHSFAVNALLHMVDIRIIKEWLGHKRIETTEIYTQILMYETNHIMQRVTY